MMHNVCTSVFLSIGALTFHTYISGNRECFLELLGGRFSGKAQKEVFQTSLGLAASISTEPVHPSGGGFSDQIPSDKVYTSPR